METTFQQETSDTANLYAQESCAENGMSVVQADEAQQSEYITEVEQASQFINKPSLTGEITPQTDFIDNKMVVGIEENGSNGETQEATSEPTEFIEMKIQSDGNGQVLQQGDVNEWKDIDNIVDIDPASAAGYLILSKEAAASLGMDAMDNSQTGDEPATKRFRIEGGDGQSYVLSVAPDNTMATGDSIVEKIETVQTNRPTMVTGADSILSQVASGNRKALENSDISQAWFTTRDEKDALHSKGATWKQGQWTKEEVDILQENINRYCAERNIIDPTTVIFEMSKDERKDFYRCIARGLQRPLFSVYRRVTRMYDQKNHIGKYTPEEINKLKELRAKFGNDWASIGSALGRSASSVKDKFRLMRDTCNSGKWLREEEKRLAAAVYDLAGVKPGENVTSGLSWALVAERVSTRSEKQCRTKWLNYLNWKQKGGTEWTREDDINLVLKISNLDVTNDTEIDWNDLASNWPSVRSPQWLRGKWWSLKRHCTEYQNMEFKDLLEYLKTVHLQNLKIKQPSQSGSSMKIIDLQTSTSSNEMTQYIPIQLNSDVDGRNDNIQYEVLQTSEAGMYFITQPVTNTSKSMTMGTDHIIVHTLPAYHLPTEENVSVEINSQSVILARGGDTDTDPLPLHMEQDSLPPVTPEELQPTAEFESNTIPEVPGMSQPPSSSDLAETPTGFVQNNVMCTLSDPMLPSGGGDFIGSSSDAEMDKAHHHDSETDLENPSTN